MVTNPLEEYMLPGGIIASLAATIKTIKTEWRCPHTDWQTHAPGMPDAWMKDRKGRPYMRCAHCGKLKVMR